MCSTVAEDLRPAVDALSTVRPQTLSVAELQTAIATVAALADRLGGWVDTAVGELSARGGGQVPAACGDGRSVPVAAWLRDATLCGGTAAGAQVRLSDRLRALPRMAEAVLDGRVGREQAAVLTRLVGRIGAEELLAAQDGLVEVATGRDPQALAVWVRELIATHCEPVLEADQRSAQTRRYLQARDQHDGTVRGSFLLPCEDYETVATVLEPLARSTGLSDGRSAGQRRADALVEVCEQALRHGELPDTAGLRPQLAYVLPAGWAADQPTPPLADTISAELPGTDTDTDSAGSGARAGAGTGPGAGQARPLQPARQACASAAWTGPQTRARIETILCDARISRVLLEQLGQVRGLESLTGAITTTQRRALAVRDQGCAARGCTRPPALCDAHHLQHREDGGDTTLHNLVLLCRRHHLMWHQGRLQRRDLHVPWITTRGTGPPQ